MPKIIFKNASGSSVEVTVRNGLTVMQAAVDSAVDGIDADCSGSCACATCHVFVDERWNDLATGATGTEAELLSALDNRQPNSRLSCQITISESLDGLTLIIPDRQGSN